MIGKISNLKSTLTSCYSGSYTTKILINIIIEAIVIASSLYGLDYIFNIFNESNVFTIAVFTIHYTIFTSLYEYFKFKFTMAFIIIAKFNFIIVLLLTFLGILYADLLVFDINLVTDEDYILTMFYLLIGTIPIRFIVKLIFNLKEVLYIKKLIASLDDEATMKDFMSKLLSKASEDSDGEDSQKKEDEEESIEDFFKDLDETIIKATENKKAIEKQKEKEKEELKKKEDDEDV